MVFHNAYGYGLFTGGLGTDGGGQRLGLCTIPVSGGGTDKQVQLIQDLEPEIIACTPSYALVLAEAVKRVDEVDLVLFGLSSTDGTMGVVPAMLAERLEERVLAGARGAQRVRRAARVGRGAGHAPILPAAPPTR